MHPAVLCWSEPLNLIGTVSPRDVCCVQGMLLHVMAVLSGTTAVVMVFALLVIIQPRPWWSAQYLIAILGLLLGTALSCVATGLSCAIDELTRGEWLSLQELFIVILLFVFFLTLSRP